MGKRDEIDADFGRRVVRWSPAAGCSGSGTADGGVDSKWVG